MVIGGAIIFGKRRRVLNPVAAVIVSFFIMKIAASICRVSIKELMEESSEEKVEEGIIGTVRNVSGVMMPHDLRTRRIGNQSPIVEKLQFSEKMTEECSRMAFDHGLADAGMGSHLFTIGYEGASLQKFLDCLEDHAVECLLDVREVPFSRKKGFSKTPLSVALEARGIHYVHFRELGSPASVREELKSGGDYRKFFRAMEDHLTTHHESIEQAYAYVSRMPCCLMCYERLAAMCHRKVVANRIKERDGNGLEVKHLKVD